MSTALDDIQRAAELYERDSVAWSEAQADALRRLAAERPELALELALDLGHIIEEIEEVGRSTSRAVTARLELLLLHLAKWRWQPDRRSASWRNTIEEQRIRLPELIADSPSLRPRLPTLLTRAWRGARRYAARETGLPLATFPEDCPFTDEQVLDEEFWPGENSAPTVGLV